MPEPYTIAAGAMDRRVKLLRPLYNEFQDEIIGWEEVATVWAAVAPMAEREADDAGRVIGRQNVAVVIRYRADIDARWRVRDRDREYEVQGLADALRCGVRLNLLCRGIT